MTIQNLEELTRGAIMMKNRDAHPLPWEMLVLAGRYTLEEDMSDDEASADFQVFVSMICATPGLSITAAALIACRLAQFIAENDL